MKSEIKGVHYSPAHKCWFSRTPHKKNLYRGESKQLAEQARISYDAGKQRASAVKTYKRKEPFRMVFQPVWPISEAFE